MTGVLLDLAGNFDIGLSPQQRVILRFATRVVRYRPLVLQIQHRAIDDLFRSTTGGIRKRHRVFDLVLLVVNTSKDEDGNDIAVFLSDPVPAVLKVEPGLKRGLHRVDR